MSSKRVTCDFYRCEVLTSRSDLPDISPEQLFESLRHACDTEGQDTVRELNSVKYEVKSVTKTDMGYEGLVIRYKATDLPHAAIPGGPERELDLDDDEQLLEKSYFAYFSDHAVLILQRNVFAVNSQKMAAYLGRDGYTVALHPIIEASDLKRLLADDVHIRVATFTIARPTNPELFSESEFNFNNSIVQSLNSTNSAKINLVLRGDGHAKDPEKRYLDPKLKRAFLELTETLDVSKAQLKLEDDEGVVHPLDLVTDRLMYDEKIEYEGKYPPMAQMKAVLARARVEKEAEIKAYFGALDETRLQ